MHVEQTQTAAWLAMLTNMSSSTRRTRKFFAVVSDRYEEALLAHLKAKQAGLPPQPQQSFALPRRAINLIEALRRSIAEDKKQPAASRKASSGLEP